MYCKHCGNKMEDGVKFCGKCGQSISGTVAASHVPFEPHKTSVWVKVLIGIVVGIPVLGILSSIVLASLNSAREKARDAATGTQVQQTDGWYKYTPVSGMFKAEFPSFPAINSETDTADDGTTYTYSSYSAEKGRTSFLLAQYVYEDEIDTSDPAIVLETFLNSFVNGIEGAEIQSSEYTYHGDHPAVDFLVYAGEEYVKGRIVLDGQVPYLIAVDYFTGEYIDADYQKFINSFET
ncbi:MAG: hypothetical protein A3A27_02140 [Candidatus Wildermuthbacteria bacterium RIFCSPLOWO2_01_FULL_47_18]|uniref:Zinc-ribbon domain-containing protein n=1 Tax=Candidatus Wildermuthbacteria bacterium RIFCSPLOWO2_01_FULL_47_18 TaxID=1802460 RepID=A0A1G2RH63_9BACT|nr:MAG: hypothetical protein A3A27_02140 [Candidatus Wildermuthbacteria bacterium RIFCSPLOWO2_01_FULL_47_18]